MNLMWRRETLKVLLALGWVGVVLTSQVVGMI